MRKYLREIAKARLKAMGIEHVNKRFGMGMKNSQARKLQRTYAGRKRLDFIRSTKEPVWRAVIFGSMAKDGRKALEGYR